MADDARKDAADPGPVDERATDPSLDRRVGEPGGPPSPDEEAIEGWTRAELLQHAEAIGVEVDPGRPREEIIEAILDHS